MIDYLLLLQLIDDQKKNNRGNSLSSYGSNKKSLGTRLDTCNVQCYVMEWNLYL